MDIFEKHFTMLKRNYEIFETFKTIENIGIRVSEKLANDYEKCGSELLTKDKTEQFREVRSIHYYNVIAKRLVEYTLPEWIVCLNEKVLLEYAIPIFSRVLKEHPMLCGMNCEWQVLYEITAISSDFWQEHKEWKKYFCNIMDRIVKEHEQGVIAFIPEVYLSNFKSFLKPRVCKHPQGENHN